MLPMRSPRETRPITSLVAVDSYTGPRVNAKYRRAHGAAPLSAHAADPTLPSLLRPQLVALGDEDLRGLERRMHYDERAAQREARVAERVSRVQAQAQSVAVQREVRLLQRAARRARVAGEVRVKEIQEEYRTMGMR